MVQEYTYSHNDTTRTVVVNDETQIAAFVYKGSKWIDSQWHEVAWQVLSPNAFKIYDKFERQAVGYVWVFNKDLFGMSEEALADAITELERKGFLEAVTRVDEDTGEVITFPSVYRFYEKVQL